MEVRITGPTNLNAFPYKTVWKYKISNSESWYYIQTSEDHTDPKWIRIGPMLEIGFKDFYENKDFIDQIVKLYEYHSNDPLERISNIIK